MRKERLISRISNSWGKGVDTGTMLQENSKRTATSPGVLPNTLRLFGNLVCFGLGSPINSPEPSMPNSVSWLCLRLSFNWAGSSVAYGCVYRGQPSLTTTSLILLCYWDTWLFIFLMFLHLACLWGYSPQIQCQSQSFLTFVLVRSLFSLLWACFLSH